MWLIDTTALSLRLFARSEGVEYAILSHTWGRDDEEVTFQDMADIAHRRTKAGWAKIKKTCQLARNMGLDYAWVDTCCIDKTSSAELSEAINSMFSWYRDSKICFVYLCTRIHNPQLHTSGNLLDNELASYRWFQRGWTLQELIAPSHMSFFNEDWEILGTKESLRDHLARITGIDTVVLKSVETLQNINIGKRFSWAAKRETKRVEDVAYCLLGIFGINMPLLYGEGSRAFIRLQEEIARSTNDLTLFAWQQSKKSAGSNWQLSGIFATSPKDFRHCDKLLVPRGKLEAETEFTLTNRGLRFDRNFDVSYPGFDSNENHLPEGDLFMRLDCLERSERTRHEARWVGIALRRIGTTYLRLFPDVVQYCSSMVTHKVSQVRQVVYIAASLSDSDAEIITKNIMVGIYYNSIPRSPIMNTGYMSDPSFRDEPLGVDGFGSGGLRSCMHLRFFAFNVGRPSKVFRMALVCGLQVHTRGEGVQDSPWALLCSEKQLLESVPRAASYKDLFAPEPTDGGISSQERTEFFRDYVFERYLDDSGHISQTAMPDLLVVEDPSTSYVKHEVSVSVNPPSEARFPMSSRYDYVIFLSYRKVYKTSGVDSLRMGGRAG
ncbi:hypothetical protein LCI18_012783 [Fusarium solani-melongenae]|uniref:Uncharacterized protein n=1 Tax=Fusarium solani subsp. cucurbitae TaxID=2747967 RepID=A0ACD3ZL88_FUSSC|nr:hypothetical protein LCI18_012783 [Fusarium solani-melongenae]